MFSCLLLGGSTVLTPNGYKNIKIREFFSCSTPVYNFHRPPLYQTDPLYSYLIFWCSELSYNLLKGIVLKQCFHFMLKIMEFNGFSHNWNDLRYSRLSFKYSIKLMYVLCLFLGVHPFSVLIPQEIFSQFPRFNPFPFHELHACTLHYFLFSPPFTLITPITPV